MTLFAWHHADDNNANLGRSNFVAAGVLGVLTTITGCVYLADFFWVVIRKALIGDESPGYY